MCAELKKSKHSNEMFFIDTKQERNLRKPIRSDKNISIPFIVLFSYLHFISGGKRATKRKQNTS